MDLSYFDTPIPPGPAEIHIGYASITWGGGVGIDPSVEIQEIAKHTASAKFVHDAGRLYLQVTGERPKDRAITAADYAHLGRLITRIGKRTADLGRMSQPNGLPGREA